jgi:hypothetical protein
MREAAQAASAYALPDPLERLRGWKDLAARLQATARLYEGHAEATVDTKTAMRYARIFPDPLPARCYQAEVWCYAIRVDEWVARRNGGRFPDGSPLAVLRGYADIQQALGGVSLTTVQRWAAAEWDALPLHAPGKPQGSAVSVWAYATAIRDWIDRHDMPLSGVLLERGHRAWVPKAALAVGAEAAGD